MSILESYSKSYSLSKKEYYEKIEDEVRRKTLESSRKAIRAAINKNYKNSNKSAINIINIWKTKNFNLEEHFEKLVETHSELCKQNESSYRGKALENFVEKFV